VGGTVSCLHATCLEGFHVRAGGYFPIGILTGLACIKDKSVIDKILSHINKKPGNQATVFNTLTIRGPPELVSLIKENRTG